MDTTLEERLNAIEWGDFGTAYGPAVNVPDQLRRLAGPDRKASMDATHELWCGLCHQHVQVGSAALPALPFLLEVLDRADRDMTIELLDILLGFALGVSQQRAEEYYQTMGRDVPSEEQWLADLRAGILGQEARFRRLAASRVKDVADIASCILTELGLITVAPPDAGRGQ